MEKPKYDNSNKISAWINEDGSLYVSGNLFGNDFKMKLFKNDKRAEGSKQPHYSGKLKPDQPKEEIKPVASKDSEDVPF